MIAVRVIAVEPKLAIQSNSDTKINDGTGGQMICKVASLLMLRLPFSLAPDDVTFLDASVVRVISGGAGGVGMRDPHSVDTEVERRPCAGLVLGAARIARDVERGGEQLVDVGVDDFHTLQCVAAQLVSSQHAADVAQRNGGDAIDLGDVACAALLLAAAGLDVGDAGAFDELVGGAHATPPPRSFRPLTSSAANLTQVASVFVCSLPGRWSSADNSATRAPALPLTRSISHARAWPLAPPAAI